MHMHIGNLERGGLPFTLHTHTISELLDDLNLEIVGDGLSYDSFRRLYDFATTTVSGPVYA